MSLTILLASAADGLTSTFTNTSPHPLALTFWWNRFVVVKDGSGAVVAPGKGPVLPCGAAEDWLVLAPGGQVTRPEPLSCTQPAGQDRDIGWSYEHLPAGRYRVTLVYRAPPWHGFTQSEPHPQAFSGVVESNAVDVEISAPGARRAGRWTRLFRR